MAKITSSLPGDGYGGNKITRTSQLINDGENGFNPYITLSDVSAKVYQFSNMTEVPVTHDLKRYVQVSVLIGVDLVMADIEYHNNLNSITVRFSKPETGLLIIK